MYYFNNDTDEVIYVRLSGSGERRFVVLQKMAAVGEPIIPAPEGGAIGVFVGKPIDRMPMAKEIKVHSLDRSVGYGGKPPAALKTTKKVAGGGAVKEMSDKAKIRSELRNKVVGLSHQGFKAQDIADKLGMPVANVYYYLKPTSGKILLPTPEKIGERDIDKKSPKVTEIHYDDMREGYNDGMSPDMYRLTYPQYDLDEIRAACKSDTYKAYLAK